MNKQEEERLKLAAEYEIAKTEGEMIGVVIAVIIVIILVIAHFF